MRTFSTSIPAPKVSVKQADGGVSIGAIVERDSTQTPCDAIASRKSRKPSLFLQALKSRDTHERGKQPINPRPFTLSTYTSNSSTSSVVPEHVTLTVEDSEVETTAPVTLNPLTNTYESSDAPKPVEEDAPVSDLLDHCLITEAGILIQRRALSSGITTSLTLTELGSLCRSSLVSKRIYGLVILKNLINMQRLSLSPLSRQLLQELYATASEPLSTKCSIMHICLLNLKRVIDNGEKSTLPYTLDVLLAAGVGDEGFLSESLHYNTAFWSLKEGKYVPSSVAFPLQPFHYALVRLGLLPLILDLLCIRGQYGDDAWHKLCLIVERVVIGYSNEHLLREAAVHAHRLQSCSANTEKDPSIQQEDSVYAIVYKFMGSLITSLLSTLVSELAGLLREGKFLSVAGRCALRTIMYDHVLDFCMPFNIALPLSHTYLSKALSASVQSVTRQNNLLATEVMKLIPQALESLARCFEEQPSPSDKISILRLSQLLVPLAIKLSSRLSDLSSSALSVPIGTVIPLRNLCAPLLCETLTVDLLSEETLKMALLLQERLILSEDFVAIDTAQFFASQFPFLGCLSLEHRDLSEQTLLIGQFLHAVASPKCPTTDNLVVLSDMSANAAGALRYLGLIMAKVTDAFIEKAKCIQAFGLTFGSSIPTASSLALHWLSYLSKSHFPSEYRFALLAPLAYDLPSRQALETGLYPADRAASALLVSTDIRLANSNIVYAYSSSVCHAGISSVGVLYALIVVHRTCSNLATITITADNPADKQKLSIGLTDILYQMFDVALLYLEELLSETYDAAQQRSYELNFKFTYSICVIMDILMLSEMLFVPLSKQESAASILMKIVASRTNLRILPSATQLLLADSPKTANDVVTAFFHAYQANGFRLNIDIMKAVFLLFINRAVCGDNAIRKSCWEALSLIKLDFKDTSQSILEVETDTDVVKTITFCYQSSAETVLTRKMLLLYVDCETDASVSRFIREILQ